MAEITWIKLTTNIFEDEKINFIESLPESDMLIVIWLKLLTLAGKINDGGFIYLTEKFPYTSEMLANKFKRPLNTIKLALETFERLEMIELIENKIYVSNWEKHQNIDGMDKIREQNRLRKQKQREKQKLLPCHVTVTGSHATEEEKEREKEKERNITQEIFDFEQYYNSMNVKKIRMTAQVQQKVKNALIDENLELWKEVIEKSANKGHLINNSFVPLSAEKMIENYSKILEEAYQLVDRETIKEVKDLWK